MNELIIKLQSLLASLEAAKLEAEAAKAALEASQGDKIYTQADMDSAMVAKDVEKQELINAYEAKIVNVKAQILAALEQQQAEENAIEGNLVNLIKSL